MSEAHSGGVSWGSAAGPSTADDRQHKKGLNHSIAHPRSLRDRAAQYMHGPVVAGLELLDNGADAGATVLEISVLEAGELKGAGLLSDQACLTSGPRLLTKDNGRAMRRVQLHRCLSHGHTVLDQKRIGMYGGGVQTGTMCLGDSALVGTRHAATAEGPEEVTVGLLSLLFMDTLALEEILLPMLTWKRAGEPASWALASPNGEYEQMNSLFQLTNFTCYHSADELLHFVLANVPGESGTVTEVFSLHRLPSSSLTVLDFDSDVHDVRLRAASGGEGDDEPPPAHVSSLRSLLEINYLRPAFTIILRGKAVDFAPVTSRLMQVISGTYAANHEAAKTSRYELGLDVVQAADGSSTLSRRQGICMYWRGRLIRPFELVGLQKPHKGISLAHGVVGAIEVDHLVPDSTKRDFTKGDDLNNVLLSLSKKLKEYVDNLSLPGDDGAPPLLYIDEEDARMQLTVEAAQRVARLFAERAARSRLNEAALADGRLFFTCDHERCRKIRFLDEGVDPGVYEAMAARDLWCCADNAVLDAAHGSCDAPQEQPRAGGKRLRFDVDTNPQLPASWRTVKVMRGAIANGSDHVYVHISPTGESFNSLKSALRSLSDGQGSKGAHLRPPPVPKPKGRKRRKPPSVDDQVGGGGDRGGGLGGAVGGESGLGAGGDSSDSASKRLRGAAAGSARSPTTTKMRLVAQLKAREDAVKAAKAAAKAEKAAAAAAASINRKKEAELARLAKELNARAVAAAAPKTRATAAARGASGRGRNAEEVDVDFNPGGMQPPPRGLTAIMEAAAAAASRRGDGAGEVERICICLVQAAECKGHVTISCDECDLQLHALCIGMTQDEAEELSYIGCADHSPRAISFRKMNRGLIMTAAAGGGTAAAPTPAASGATGMAACIARGGEVEMSSNGTPHGWPSNVLFTQRSMVSLPADEDALALFRLSVRSRPLPGVRIRVLPKEHPLVAGQAAVAGRHSKPRGLFAVREFAADAEVGEYTGHVRFKTHRDTESDYIFTVNELKDSLGRAVQVDAGAAGNETRFINAHKMPGESAVVIAQEPNVRFTVEQDQSPAAASTLVTDCFRVVVRTLRSIHPGEELLVDYGPAYHQ